jgi:hypothetical protein
MNRDVMPDSENMPDDAPKEADDAEEINNKAAIEPKKKIAEKSKSLHDEVEALIAGKVRSLTNPRSG